MFTYKYGHACEVAFIVITIMICNVLVLLAAVALVSATEFKDCRTLFNRAVGKPPLALKIDGCDKPPCTFVRGTKVSGLISFVADADITELRPEITAYVRGIPFNFPVNQTDACRSLIENQCPLGAGDQASFNLNLKLPANLPTVKPVMRYAFRDQTNTVFICAEVPTIIVAGASEESETEKPAKPTKAPSSGNESQPAKPTKKPKPPKSLE